MDSDFDDDIADEDLLTALDQASSSNGGQALQQSGISNTSKTIGQQETAAELLENLPSDAFSSPEPQPAPPKPKKVDGFAWRTARTGAPVVSLGSNSSQQRGFRQTTLWGEDATIDEIRQSQPSSGRTLHASRPHEEPTQHEIDRKAMETWVYPTNLGAIRDYQYSIVRNSLFNNTLVALPTGLGKTFIAATVMLNFYRWTTKAKIIFVAPTKPLVSQQIDACFHIAGIPRSETTLLTGDVAPALRADEWERRRVFFMTPQTLVNDLSHGYADPKSIALIVIDEAHRATGEYAYAKATKMIRRFSKSFRVLALTATPGSKVETVQEVIDNLGISHCEIRTEESIDIRQYVHNRDIDQVVLDPSDEINLISELFTEALKPLTEKLSAQNIWYGRNPMALTTYGLIIAQKEWFNTRGQHANSGLQFMMRAIFSALTSLAHSIKLLQFHGIGPFYDNMVDFRSEQESKGDKGSKYKQQVVQSTSFQEMMDKMAGWIKQDGFVGHPKLTALAEAVLNHFMDAGESSRVIVFSEYRDSADTIVRMLNSHRPLIKATTFVGQADGKRGEGMTQKQQIETIERFKGGEYNVLVATSIGEEGLDIGQVDLIVCYDASASPIRMLQRMGRTGRKRAGKIILLLMRGKEEEQYAKSKDNYEKMQKLICEGSRFNFRFDLSTRIVPRDIRPEVDKRHVEIPVENTQDASLPEPRKRRAPGGKKKPPKKFHMPDGVETGFHTVAEMLRPKKAAAKKKLEPERGPEVDDVVAIPTLERVVLGEDELRELNRSYRDLPFNNDVVEETELPDMTAHPEAQRTLGPVVRVQHGTHTRRCVGVLGKMGTEPNSLLRPCRRVDTSNYLAIPVKPFAAETETGSSDSPGPTRKRPVDREGGQKPQQQQKKMRKTTTTTTTTATTTSNKRTAPKPVPQKPFKKPATFVFHNSSEAEETDDDGSEHEIPQAEDGVTIISIENWKKKKRSKGKEDKSREHNIYSDEVGDDCERDSDLLLDMADSDNGSDLVDFVVRDSQLTSSARRLGTSSPAVGTYFRERGAFTPTPESEASLEDVEVLVASAGGGGKRKRERGEEDRDRDRDRPARRARARRAVVDSESDE